MNTSTVTSVTLGGYSPSLPVLRDGHDISYLLYYESFYLGTDQDTYVISVD